MRRLWLDASCSPPNRPLQPLAFPPAIARSSFFATPVMPSQEMLPDLLALSDVMGTGWFGAAAAQVPPGSTVAVVGDGVVGLLAVLSAKQRGAERIIVMSRHASRQQLARTLGAIDIVEERGAEGVARIQDMTNGLGVDGAIECGAHRNPCGKRSTPRAWAAMWATWACPMAWKSRARNCSSSTCTPRRPSTGAPVPATPDRADAGRYYSSWTGVRFDSAAGAGGRGLPGHGARRAVKTQWMPKCGSNRALRPRTWKLPQRKWHSIVLKRLPDWQRTSAGPTSFSLTGRKRARSAVSRATRLTA